MRAKNFDLHKNRRLRKRVVFYIKIDLKIEVSGSRNSINDLGYKLFIQYVELIHVRRIV